MIPSAVHQVTFSSSDDCVPQSSASESAVPTSAMPSSSESPSNEISPDPNVSQEAVTATSSSPPSLSASIAVVAAPPPPPVCMSSINITTKIMSPSSSVSSFSPVNPLVCAGLVPEDLSDILVTPSSDAAVAKKRMKRIVGARHLTSDEFVEMLKCEKRKKKERVTVRAHKLRSKDPTASQTVQTKNPKTIIIVHNLDQVLVLPSSATWYTTCSFSE